MEKRQPIQTYLHVKSQLKRVDDEHQAATNKLKDLQADQVRTRKAIAKIKSEVKTMATDLEEKKCAMHLKKKDLARYEKEVAQKQIEISKYEQKFAKCAKQFRLQEAKVGSVAANITSRHPT